MEYYANTDVGNARTLNEDSYLVKSYNGNSLLAIIADGMGGHNAGEKASRLAVDAMASYIDSKNPDIYGFSDRKICMTLEAGVKTVNSEVYAESKLSETLNGMGTTLVTCLLSGNDYHVSNVGDSRMYVIENGQMRQITKDHSYVAELIEIGVITKEQAITHPKKNVITRAIGSEDDIESDVFYGSLCAGSYIILCTDGLTNMVGEDEICDVILNSDSIKLASETLIDKANEAGGRDNITLIIIKC